MFCNDGFIYLEALLLIALSTPVLVSVSKSETGKFSTKKIGSCIYDSLTVKTNPAFVFSYFGDGIHLFIHSFLISCITHW